jgi:hypothetical protein
MLDRNGEVHGITDRQLFDELGRQVAKGRGMLPKSCSLVAQFSSDVGDISVQTRRQEDP